VKPTLRWTRGLDLAAAGNRLAADCLNGEPHPPQRSDVPDVIYVARFWNFHDHISLPA
jgi:hypothetical protein